MSATAYKTRLVLTSASILAIAVGLTAFLYSDHRTWSMISGLGAFFAFMMLMQAIQVVGLSASVPGEPVMRGEHDKGPPESIDAVGSQHVRFVASESSIERLTNSGRWVLRLILEVRNARSSAISIHDIRFHVYCRELGLPLLAIGVPDYVKVTETNSIMSEGKTYPISEGSSRRFKLTPSVTREPDSKGFLVIFGVFVYFTSPSSGSSSVQRVPCESIFVVQNDHLVDINADNVALYREKHKSSLQGSILVAVCEDALKKQLAAV